MAAKMLLALFIVTFGCSSHDPLGCVEKYIKNINVKKY